ncbi:MAG: hypothetical protein DHS20C08_19300 [Rhodomicrobium sp.]|nr:MAG: hypothetical protein DHS20C08_19300 [Rhodomicrobium sp.]
MALSYMAESQHSTEYVLFHVNPSVSRESFEITSIKPTNTIHSDDISKPVISGAGSSGVKTTFL